MGKKKQKLVKSANTVLDNPNIESLVHYKKFQTALSKKQFALVKEEIILIESSFSYLGGSKLYTAPL